MAKVATVKLSSVSPYSQSAPHEEPKLERETADAYDERTWRHHLHTNTRGEVIIPCSCFTNALVDAAKYDSTKIPGKGSSTYTKHIQAGVMVVDEIPLGIAAEMIGRRCRAMEISPPFVDVAIRRWQLYTGAEAVLEDGSTYAQVRKQRRASEKRKASRAASS